MDPGAAQGLRVCHRHSRDDHRHRAGPQEAPRPRAGRPTGDRHHRPRVVVYERVGLGQLGRRGLLPVAQVDSGEGGADHVPALTSFQEEAPGKAGLRSARHGQLPGRVEVDERGLVSPDDEVGGPVLAEGGSQVGQGTQRAASVWGLPLEV